MNTDDKAHLVDGKYGIRDLVDLDELRRIFERFTEATGFTLGFLDHPGMNILVATGWRDICTKFHRGCPISAANCERSNRHLLDQLDEPGKLVVEQCDNGLVDCAFPIIVKGKHIASLATGQLLLEKPDLERFRRQAKLFGCDEREYLRALGEVPVIPEEKLRSVTTFLGEMALLLSQLGYARLTAKAEAERLERESAVRKKAEEALRASEERLQQAVRASGLGFYDHDFRADVIHWSPEMRQIHGFSPEEPVRAPMIPECVHPEDRQRVVEAIRRAHDPAGDGLYAVEHRIVRRDGGVRWLIRRSRTFFEGEGSSRRLLRTVGAVMDITDRKRAEIRLRRLYECGMIAILYWNVVGVVTDANDAFLEMIGYDREDLAAGRIEWGRITPIEYRHLDEEAIESLRRTGAHAPFEKEYIRKDGGRVHVLIGGAFLDEARYEGVNFVLDITERKRAEAERGNLEAQLRQAQKMESVGRLAGGVAHDFNNMLGVILGHAEMAMGQVDPSLPLHGHLDEIRKAAQRSADLTRKLLAFGRRQTTEPRVLDLNETVAGMLKMLHRLIGENIDLVWQPAADLWPVKMDPSQIEQILANLCVNARDAISGVGKMTIETGNKIFDAEYCAAHTGFVPGTYVLLGVSDSGCGMDRETLSHLFEPYFTTKETGKGTGLGLATVYGIVKQNNGFINVYSEPGHGTTFKILLPRCVGKAEQARAAGAARPVLRGHETILLVEDEPATLKMAAVMLQRQGYAVLVAGTPGDAISLAREYAGEIHLLLTDVVMPEMNGRDLAEHLRSLYPQLKRLFMSGYTANVIAHHGVLDEGVHFIQKPFAIQDLSAKVRQALDEP